MYHQCLPLVLISAAHREKGFKITCKGKQWGDEAINGEKGPRRSGQGKACWYDNTEEVEPKSPSVYCLALTEIKWGTFPIFNQKRRQTVNSSSGGEADCPPDSEM